jgi:hypothetical protein
MAPRRTWAIVAAAALAATRAGAPPPLSSFPDVIVPPGLSSTALVVPQNARLWLFGDGAPDAANVGLVVTVDGAVIDDGPLERRGCCLVTTAPAWSAGSNVHVLASTASAEREVDFVVGAVVDAVSPTLSDVVVLDDSGGALVVGVSGNDDVGLAGFLALDDAGATLSAAPVGRVLIAALPDGAACIDVVAVDLAGHASAPLRSCRNGGEGEGEGEGEGGGEGEGEGEADGAACSSTTRPMPWELFASLVVFFVGSLSRSRRVRCTH